MVFCCLEFGLIYLSLVYVALCWCFALHFATCGFVLMLVVVYCLGFRLRSSKFCGSGVFCRLICVCVVCLSICGCLVVLFSMLVGLDFVDLLNALLRDCLCV